MTQQSKVAFADKTAAEAVQKEQGGELGDFDTALQAAYQGMASNYRHDPPSAQTRSSTLHG